MKKYLLINSLKFGGAERVAQILANAEVFDEVILLEDEKDYSLNIPISKLSQHTNKTSPVLKTLFIPIYAWRLHKIINKGDIVVSFIERANFVNIISKLFFNHKTIITLHSNISLSFKTIKKYPYYILIKILYPKADAVISVSNGVNNDFKNIVNFKKYNSIINNPIDIKLINNLKDRPVSFSEEFLRNSIISVGRLFYQKAQWTLIKIFSDTLIKNPNVKLFIIGDGDLREKLLAYAKDLNLKVFSIFTQSIKEINSIYNIYFLGFQENPYQFVAKSTIFALSSVSEGSSMVILEAMACGLPILSSDCDYGPREILTARDKKFGILLPVLDFQMSDNIDVSDKKYQAWVNAFSDIFNDKDKRDNYKQLSLSRANDFSVDDVKIIWQNLFKNFPR